MGSGRTDPKVLILSLILPLTQMDPMPSFSSPKLGQITGNRTTANPQFSGLGLAAVQAMRDGGGMR